MEDGRSATDAEIYQARERASARAPTREIRPERECRPIQPARGALSAPVDIDGSAWTSRGRTHRQLETGTLLTATRSLEDTLLSLASASSRHSKRIETPGSPLGP